VSLVVLPMYSDQINPITTVTIWSTLGFAQLVCSSTHLVRNSLYAVVVVFSLK